MRELRVSVRSFISWIRCSIRIVGTVCDGMNGKRAENPVPPLARAAPDISRSTDDAAREPRPGCGLWPAPRAWRGRHAMPACRPDGDGTPGPPPGRRRRGGGGARHARRTRATRRDARQSHNAPCDILYGFSGCENMWGVCARTRQRPTRPAPRRPPTGVRTADGTRAVAESGKNITFSPRAPNLTCNE